MTCAAEAQVRGTRSRSARGPQQRVRGDSRSRSCAAGDSKPFDVACAHVFSMYCAASGVLQAVSPWSTSTLPIRLAAASAALRRPALRPPIVMTASCSSPRARAFGAAWIVLLDLGEALREPARRASPRRARPAGRRAPSRRSARPRPSTRATRRPSPRRAGPRPRAWRRSRRTSATVDRSRAQRSRSAGVIRAGSDDLHRQVARVEVAGVPEGERELVVDADALRERLQRREADAEHRLRGAVAGVGLARLRGAGLLELAHRLGEAQAGRRGLRPLGRAGVLRWVLAGLMGRSLVPPVTGSVGVGRWSAAPRRGVGPRHHADRAPGTHTELVTGSLANGRARINGGGRPDLPGGRLRHGRARDRGGRLAAPVGDPRQLRISGALQQGTCRRARARIRFTGTDLDFVLPVAIWPQPR